MNSKPQSVGIGSKGDGGDTQCSKGGGAEQTMYIGGERVER